MTPLRRFARARATRVTFWTSANLAVATVTGIVTARTLGPDSRGTLALAISISGLCVLLGALGSNVAIRRHLPRAMGVNLSGYVRLSGLLFVPLVVLLIGMTLILALTIGGEFSIVRVMVAFVAVGGCYFFSNQALDLLNAQGRTPLAARVNAAGSVVCLALVLVSALANLDVSAIIASYAASFLVQGIIAFQLSLGGMPLREYGTPMGMQRLVRDGSKLLGLNLGQSLTYRADTVLLGAMAPTSDVGLYAVATTPASILRLPATAMGQVLVHDLATGAMSRRLVLKRVLWVELALLPVAVVGWLAADWVIPLVFGQPFAAAAEPFRVLLIAELALTPFLIISRALVGIGGTWGGSIAGIAGTIALVISGLAFIPSAGALGAAWASVVAYAVMSIIVTLRYWWTTRIGSE